MSGGTRNPRDTVEVPDPSLIKRTADKVANAVTDALIPAAKDAMADAKDALDSFDPQKKEERCVFFLKWGRQLVYEILSIAAIGAWGLEILGYDVRPQWFDRAVALASTEPGFPCPPVECICEPFPVDGPPPGE